MEPATLTALSKVAAVVGAGASVAGGIQAKRAADLEAAQFADAQESARVAAEQDEVQRREQLQRVLGSQQAIRAGRGLPLFSGSAKALRSETTRQAERDILTARANYLSQQRKFGLGASSARASGAGSLIRGVGHGGRQLLNSGIFDKKKDEGSAT